MEGFGGCPIFTSQQCNGYVQSPWWQRIRLSWSRKFDFEHGHCVVLVASSCACVLSEFPS